jgi:uncharacterized protein YabE (DUF348 family)
MFAKKTKMRRMLSILLNEDFQQQESDKIAPALEVYVNASNDVKSDTVTSSPK